MEKIKKKLSPTKDDVIPANAAEYKTGFMKWLPMVILSLALMIIVIDTTVLNVSLKTIVNDLGTDLQGLQWVITSYALTLAALTITGGRLGDLFGRKKMFMIGAAIFAVGSFVTSISTSVGMMVIGESIIEGVGAALMMPATASLLVANYKGRDRAIAFGIWGGIAAASAGLGPLLGGFLTTNYSWRWAFRINIVVAIVLLIGAAFISESRDNKHKRELDFVGIFLSAFGLLSLVYGVIESSTYGWFFATHPYSVFSHAYNFGGLSISPIAIGLGIVILGLFALWERYVENRGKTPLVSLHIFANKQFTAGSIVTALLSLGMVGLIFAVPVFLQSTRDLTAFQTGLALLPMSLAMLIVAPSSAVLAKHFTAKRLIQTGLALAIAASVTLYFLISPDASALTLAPGLMLFGAGMGLVMAQASNITLSAVPVSESGEASGINNTLRQVGSSFGSAIIGAVLLTTLSASLMSGISDSKVIPSQAKAQLSGAFAAQASNVELGGGSAESQTKTLPQNIKDELTQIAHQASADGSKKAMLITGAFVLLAAGVSTQLPNVKDFEHKEVAVSGH